MPTAVITGATAGIGRAFAERLARDAYDLVLVARNAERLDELAQRLREEHGVNVEVLVTDLALPDQRAVVEERLADPTRPVDLLVNNAGRGVGSSFLDSAIETEEAVFELNAHAVLRLTKAVLPGMVARRSGAVVNVSSVAAWVPRGSYAASKAYVLSLSRSAAIDVAPCGVVVQALCPGMTHTEFHARAGSDAERRVPEFLWLSADRVVADSLAALARGRTVCIPGRRWRVIVAVTRLVPARLSVLIARRGTGEMPQPRG